MCATAPCRERHQWAVRRSHGYGCCEEADMTRLQSYSWRPAELHRRLDGGRRFSILDVRNRDEFDAWRIEGKDPIQTLNIPYYDLLDLDREDEEIAAAVARAAPDRLGDRLPRGSPVLVVCAKGDTSTHVAEGL